MRERKIQALCGWALVGLLAVARLKSRAGEIATGIEGVREVGKQIMVNP